MSRRATVLIPTHDHGPLLAYAARSALAQSVADLELFIVGDGVPPLTKALVAALQDEDSRIRFFDFPKGPRNGEAYRDEVLAHASGRIVCYLSDDDLWLPHHVATMETLLDDADFVYALGARVEPDGTLLAGNTVDYRIPGIRQLVMSDALRLGGAPLSCMAHTMDMYWRLPERWRATPPGIATNVYMCRKVFGNSGCRWINASIPTVLRFPSPPRAGRTLDQRAAELAEWARQVNDPAWVAAFPYAVLDALARTSAEHWGKIKHLKSKMASRKRGGGVE